MVQRVEALATKPDYLSLLPLGTHMVEGENQFLQVVLWCLYTYTYNTNYGTFLK